MVASWVATLSGSPAASVAPNSECVTVPERISTIVVCDALGASRSARPESPRSTTTCSVVLPIGRVKDITRPSGDTTAVTERPARSWRMARLPASVPET